MPAKKEDVTELMKSLDSKITERQARESGVCPVREELFTQCFDELIRQDTLDTIPDRGLLLAKVRDDFKKTIDAYQTLYQSSVVYSIRKKKQAMQERPQRVQELEEKIKKNTALKKKVAELEAKKAAQIKRVADAKEANINRMKMEKEFYDDVLSNLFSYLKSISDITK
jgi:dynein light intermediate chain